MPEQSPAARIREAAGRVSAAAEKVNRVTDHLAAARERLAPVGLCGDHAHLRAAGLGHDPGGALIVPAGQCKVCHPAAPAAAPWSGPADDSEWAVREASLNLDTPGQATAIAAAPAARYPR